MPHFFHLFSVRLSAIIVLTISSVHLEESMVGNAYEKISLADRADFFRHRHLATTISQRASQSGYDLSGVYRHWLNELLFNFLQLFFITAIFQVFSMGVSGRAPAKASVSPGSIAIRVPAL